MTAKKSKYADAEVTDQVNAMLEEHGGETAEHESDDEMPEGTHSIGTTQTTGDLIGHQEHPFES